MIKVELLWMWRAHRPEWYAGCLGCSGRLGMSGSGTFGQRQLQMVSSALTLMILMQMSPKDNLIPWETPNSLKFHTLQLGFLCQFHISIHVYLGARGTVRFNHLSSDHWWFLHISWCWPNDSTNQLQCECVVPNASNQLWLERKEWNWPCKTANHGS